MDTKSLSVKVFGYFGIAIFTLLALAIQSSTTMTYLALGRSLSSASRRALSSNKQFSSLLNIVDEFPG
jgi:hypothetical protein